jgi:hypothetical protein
MDGLAGVLESIGHVARGLAILATIIITAVVLLVLLVAESFGYAQTLLRGMLGAFMDQTRSVKELCILLIVAALSARLIKGGDEVVLSATSELPFSRTLWPVATVTIIGVVVAVVVVAVAFIIAPFFAVIIIVTGRMIGSRNSGNVFFMALIGFLSISVMVGRLEHLANHCRWRPVELSAELVVVIEPVDEGGDNLRFEDVGDAVPHFAETADVASKEFTSLLVNPSQVMLGAWSLASSHVVLNKHPLEIIPRSDGFQPQTCEPGHGSGFEHDGQIICHYIGASSSSPHSNRIAGKPLLGVSLAVILLDPGNLETYRPLDGPQPGCKSSWSLWTTNDGSITSGRLSGVAGGRCNDVTRVGGGDRLKSRIRIGPLSVVLLSASDLLFMT